MFGSLQAGQQVRAVRDVKNWAGVRVIRRGQGGIVREVHSGFLFGTEYVVEFSDGWLTHNERVRHADVRRRVFDSGDEGWSSRRQWELGIRLGLFVAFGLPALFALIRYFVFDGGTTDDLIAALPDAVLGSVMDAIAILGPLGVALVAGALYLRSRRRGGT
jgi:hypothetical protein